MLADLGEIIRDVGVASSLDEALATLALRIEESLAVDAFAVYLADTEAGRLLLKASDSALQENLPGKSNPQSGLVDLVGERREPLILANATSHPRYVPDDEAGERHFETFLGVPLIHYHEVLGVLVAWRRAAGGFGADEVSFFITIAARLAQVVHESTNADVVVRLLRESGEEGTFIQGARAARGIAIGTATLLDPLAKLEAVPNRPAMDRDAEELAFHTAILAATAALRASQAGLAETLTTDVRELFDLYVMLLGDDRLVADTLDRIRAGSWAPGAWRETISEHAQRFDRMEDPYLRARAEDIRNLGTLVLGHLQSGFKEPRQYPERCILVGDSVSVQEIAAVPLDQLAGVVSRHGSAFSHAAVLANALGLPAVVSLSSLPAGLVEGATMVVDGDEARIYVNPSRTLLDAFEHRIEEQKALSARLMYYRGLAAETQDGFRLPLYANIGLDSDVQLASDSEAEGVGLYRSEYQFLLRDAFPVEQEQYRSYRSVLERFSPKPVTIRTLDVGGDKILSYFPLGEDDPSLGVRGIRFSLAHPETFMIQLRALLRANAGLGNLHVLFPMVARIGEVDEALDLLERAHRELLEEGQPAEMPQVGVMIEVPSSVFLTRALAKRVDYFSIGTNDLAQYILAAARTNARVTTPNDSLHPAVLTAISMVVRDAHAAGKPVHVCGEMAGDSAGALVLLGLGVDCLSMSPARFEHVKRVIRAFTLESAQSLAADALVQEDESQVVRLLEHSLTALAL